MHVVSGRGVLFPPWDNSLFCCLEWTGTSLDLYHLFKVFVKNFLFDVVWILVLKLQYVLHHLIIFWTKKGYCPCGCNVHWFYVFPVTTYKFPYLITNLDLPKPTNLITFAWIFQSKFCICLSENMPFSISYFWLSFMLLIGIYQRYYTNGKR